jgi:hypothetical protein
MAKDAQEVQVMKRRIILKECMRQSVNHSLRYEFQEGYRAEIQCQDS